MLNKTLRTCLGLLAALCATVGLAQNEFYVTGFSRNKVFAFDSTTGILTRTIGSAAVGLNGPMGMAIDGENRLYVANNTSGRIMRFFLSNGAVDVSFNVPCTNCRDLLIGPDGNLWALTGNQVRRFNLNGLDLGNTLTGGTLRDGYDFEFGPDGKLYITDWAPSHTNDRNVKRYFASGAFEKIFVVYNGAGQVRRPNGILFDAAGNAYVSDAESNRVAQFTASGGYLRIFSNTGATTGPSRLKFGPDSNLYVACGASGTVRRFQGPTGSSPGAFMSEFISSTKLEGGSCNYILFSSNITGAVESLDIVPDAVVGGIVHTTGIVTLGQRAPSGGTRVELTSNDTNAATVPASITIAAGKKSGTFLITSRRVTTPKNVTVTAKVGSQTKTAVVTILPLLKSLTLVKNSVSGGDNLFGVITLNTRAASNTTLTIQTSNGNATILGQTTIIIPAGSMSGVFEINTRTVTVDTNVTITVNESGSVQTAVLTVRR